MVIHFDLLCEPHLLNMVARGNYVRTKNKYMVRVFKLQQPLCMSFLIMLPEVLVYCVTGRERLIRTQLIRSST